MNDITNAHTQDIIYALAAANNTIFAARMTGTYASSDGGKTWHDIFEATPGLHGVAVTALAVREDRMIAGITGAAACSSDGGMSWQVVGLASPPPLLTDILFAPHDANLVLAGTADDGVFISADGGGSWVAWNFGLVDLKVNCLAAAPDHAIFAGTESGIYRSHNDGKSWRDLPFPMSAAPVLSIGFSDRRVFAGTQSSGLFYADHGGGTWSAVPDLPMLQSEAIHAIVANGNEVLILSDHHLVHFQADDLAHRVLDHFPDRQAISLAQTEHHAFIGFVDGAVESRNNDHG